MDTYHHAEPFRRKLDETIDRLENVQDVLNGLPPRHQRRWNRRQAPGIKTRKVVAPPTAFQRLRGLLRL